MLVLVFVNSSIPLVRFVQEINIKKNIAKDWTAESEQGKHSIPW